ncbi:MAG: prenyltransferase [Dysgonamonadaceae bacterium]|jgi:1,4-dihydroxy-2-naphthoate octaprenyltransferase|nr:prenyltransferase [Dysgonamonadaceae bacterium]
MKRLVLKDWIEAVRPWSYPVSLSPAIVALLDTIWLIKKGNVFPNIESRWYLGALAVLGAVLFHSAGNLISDYHDFRTGIDKAGNPGATSLTSGRFQPKQILTFGLTFLAVGIAVGLLLLHFSGVGLLYVGVVGIAACLFYFLLKSRALGDLLIFIIFGPSIVMGVAFVMLGYYEWLLFWVALPEVFITVNVLHSNNTRDMQRDKAAGTTTFAKLLGLKASIFYYCLLTVFTYSAVVVMILLHILPVWTLLTWLTVPIAVRNCKTMLKARSSDTSPINDVDRMTAQLQLGFSVLMTVGLIIALIV